MTGTTPKIITFTIVTNTILYISFLILDLLPENSVPFSPYIASTCLKYTSIIICFIAGLYISRKNRSIMPALPLALTLFADTFLLLLDSYYVIGTTAFAIVQTIYGIYLIKQHISIDNQLHQKSHHHNIATISITTRIILYIVILIAIWQINTIDTLIIVSIWSYVNLILNTIHSLILTAIIITNFKSNTKSKAHSQTFYPNYHKHISLFFTGLLLFLACDTCVGLSNLGSYTDGIPAGNILSVISYLMWVFYLPSQEIIVYSFSHINRTNDNKQSIP